VVSASALAVHLSAVAGSEIVYGRLGQPAAGVKTNVCEMRVVKRWKSFVTSGEIRPWILGAAGARLARRSSQRGPEHLVDSRKN